MILGDVNRLSTGKTPSSGDLEAAIQADVIILPQGCSHNLYRIAAQNAPHVFPDYKARFQYPGTIGQARLYQESGAPLPRTVVFEDLDDFTTRHCVTNPPISFPCVIKFDQGEEGASARLLYSQEDLLAVLEMVKDSEKKGYTGFLLQEKIDTGGRSLRVAVLNNTLLSYWRVADQPTGVPGGIRIDRQSAPHLIARGEKAVRNFCHRTGVNLAGFDLWFSVDDPDPEPLFWETNYNFSRRGLGGSEQYYIMLLQAVDEWLEENTPENRLPLARGA